MPHCGPIKESCCSNDYFFTIIFSLFDRRANKSENVCDIFSSEPLVHDVFFFFSLSVTFFSWMLSSYRSEGH